MCGKNLDSTDLMLDKVSYVILEKNYEIFVNQFSKCMNGVVVVAEAEGAAVALLCTTGDGENTISCGICFSQKKNFN